MDGTARKDRHVDPVRISPGAVEAPSFLSGAARDAWDRWIAPRASTGWYEPAEAPMLAMWCELVVRVFSVGAATPFEGVYEQEDAYGRAEFKKHPGVTAMVQLMAEFRALSARLGLDPLSRMALADLKGPGVGERPQLPKGAPDRIRPDD
jgi:P27 family predicted phage terminase small subunit